MSYKYAVQKVENSFTNRVLYNDQLLTQISNDDGQKTIINYNPYAQFSHFLTYDDFPTDFDHNSS